MEPTQRHIWQHLLNPKVVIVVIGCVAIVVAVGMFVGRHGEVTAPTGSNNLTPSSGPEGTQIAVSVPAGTTVPAHATVKFTDKGEHGYVAVKSGGGMYVTYDPATNLTYSADATAGANSLSATVPDGICGLVIKSAQEPAPVPKMVNVSVVAPDGAEIASGIFAVQCDTYTLSIKTTASADPVLPDGKDSSVITATLAVHGPAQFINGTRIKPGQQKPILDTPLGLVMVHFTTDLGALAPNPANIKTDLNGQASVTITSADAGIASVRAIAQGIGDAIQKVHFPPKITAVKMDFIEPVSPTNYQLRTIPANAKDLDFVWTFAYGGSGTCGYLTGPVQGKNLLTNGYFHGPADGYPQGCPEKSEFASKVTVTVTDKDAQSSKKTFGARAFEGQGFVALP